MKIFYSTIFGAFILSFVSCASQPPLTPQRDVEILEREAPVTPIQSNAESVQAEADYSNGWGLGRIFR